MRRFHLCFANGSLFSLSFLPPSFPSNDHVQRSKRETNEFRKCLLFLGQHDASKRKCVLLWDDNVQRPKRETILVHID